MMEKPTPALPKGGGIMFFCPSVRYKGVGFYLPSLGVIDEVASLVEEWGWGWVSVSPPFGRGWGWVSGSGLRPEWGIDMSAPGSARGIGFRRDTPPKGAKE